MAEKHGESLGALLARRNEIEQLLASLDAEQRQTSDCRSQSSGHSGGAGGERVSEMQASARRQLTEIDTQIVHLKAQMTRAHGRSAGSSSSQGGASSAGTSRPSAAAQLALNRLASSKAACGSGGSSHSSRIEASMVSFTSSMDGSQGADPAEKAQRVDVVYSLLNMLSPRDRLDSARTLVQVSRAADTCDLMRQSGCVPILVQLLHPATAATSSGASTLLWNQPPTDGDIEVMSNAAEALHNLVRRQPAVPDMSQTICAAVNNIMKMSFDENHRLAIAQLGGLQSVGELLIGEQLVWGTPEASQGGAPTTTVRRLLGMALTNLTFGNPANKRTLCACPMFLDTVNAQVASHVHTLRQVFASVLRNLSWKAEASGKSALRASGAVSGLVQAAIRMENDEATLKALLSALWNLTAHCTENKVEVCQMEGAIEFLAATLHYKSPNGALAVVENASGILRNLSSQIALNEQYRTVLRRCNVAPVLLRHLKSSSLTLVSTACHTLWNLSARCAADQKLLIDLGAVPMLRCLVDSKHKMIAMAASAALKNLLSSKVLQQQPHTTSNSVSSGAVPNSMDGSTRSGSQCVNDPMLTGPMGYRKLRHLEKELDARLLADFTLGDGHGIGFKSAAPDYSSAREMNTAMTNSSRSHPTENIMSHVGHLVQPVPAASARSCKPDADSMWGGASCSGQSQRYNTMPSKQERMHMDRLATQRVHNTLRKQNHAQLQPCGNAGALTKDRLGTSSQPDVNGRGAMEQFGDASAQPHSQHWPQGDLQHGPDSPEEHAKDFSRMSISERYGAVLAGGSGGDNNTHTSDNPHHCSRAPNFVPRDDPANDADCSLLTGGTKSVQICTPTYSRHSSCESLDSAAEDADSIRSYVVSAYSTNVPTGIVSPSQLPDSPSQSMPDSPAPGKRAHRADTSNDMDGDPPLQKRDERQNVQSEDCSPVGKESRHDITKVDGNEPQSMAGADLSPITIDESPSPKRRPQKNSHDPPDPQTPSNEPDYATYDPSRDSLVVRQSIEKAMPRPKPPPPMPPVRYQSAAAATQQGNPVAVAGVDNDPISKMIRAAMPQPQTHGCERLRGKNVAVTRPMMREPNPTAASQPSCIPCPSSAASRLPRPQTHSQQDHGASANSNGVATGASAVRTQSMESHDPAMVDEAPTVFAVQGTPQTRSRSVSPPLRQDGDKKSGAAPATEQRGVSNLASASRSAESVPDAVDDQSLVQCISSAMPKPKLTQAAAAASPLSNVESPRRLALQKLIQEERGLMEMSGCSVLLASSAGTAAGAISSCSMASNRTYSLGPGVPNVFTCSGVSHLLEDEQPPNEWLVNHSSTESDAVVLIDKVKRQAPNGLSDDEYLSEDSFGHMEIDDHPESIISVHDIDLDPCQANTQPDNAPDVVQVESEHLNELLTGDDLLIDCENYSIDGKGESSNDGEKEPSESEKRGPTILKGPKVEAKKVAPPPAKVIRPGANKATPATPRLPVRLTKASQLRAKRVSESSSAEALNEYQTAIAGASAQNTPKSAQSGVKTAASQSRRSPSNLSERLKSAGKNTPPRCSSSSKLKQPTSNDSTPSPKPTSQQPQQQSTSSGGRAAPKVAASRVPSGPSSAAAARRAAAPPPQPPPKPQKVPQRSQTTLLARKSAADGVDSKPTRSPSALVAPFNYAAHLPQKSAAASNRKSASPPSATLTEPAGKGAAAAKGQTKGNDCQRSTPSPSCQPANQNVNSTGKSPAQQSAGSGASSGSGSHQQPVVSNKKQMLVTTV